MKLNSDIALQRLNEIAQGRYTFKPFIYNNQNQKIKCKCNKCNTEWESIYSNLVYSKQGCPKCPVKISKVEKQIRDIINLDSIICEYNVKDIISPYELDIIINNNVAFEIDGVFWHSDQFTDKYKDMHLQKTKMCENKGIRLFHIYDSEIYDKNQKDIWQSIILNSIQQTTQRIHARKCEIKEISNHEAKDFCEANHLQGGIYSKVNIGAFHESKLVAVMTFGVPRYNKQYEWELLRFCSLKFHRINGIASRLLAYFKKAYNPLNIISYGNRRWCSKVSNVYQKLGFSLVGESQPNYFYVKNGRLHSRLEFQKHKLRAKLDFFDKELTESENMKLNGYGKIYDCGNLVYEMRCA